MKSTDRMITDHIERRPRGVLFTSADFMHMGTPEAVRKALDRMEDRKAIARVAHGIYARPRSSKRVGTVLPTAEEVAEAIARRDRIRTLPTGSYALNALGLSTQVPANLVLLTDGTPRVIRVGRRTIRFKKTTPRNLAAKGRISSLVIQALKEIGNGRASEEEERRIIDVLGKEDRKNLMHDIALAPVWIRKIMGKALLDG